MNKELIVCLEENLGLMLLLCKKNGAAFPDEVETYHGTVENID